MTINITYFVDILNQIGDLFKKSDGIKSLTEFGAKGNANHYDPVSKKYFEDPGFTIEASDDTQAIMDAVAYSKLKDFEIKVPNRNYLFTQSILWDGKISFIGQGSTYSPKFIKHFNGDGFKIEADYCTLLNVSIYCSEKFRISDTGSGLVLGNDQAIANIRANYANIDIKAMYHGLNGLDCQKGNQGFVRGYYDQNKQDGVHMDSQWAGGAADWNANRMDFTATGNGRHGMWLYRAEANTIRAILQGNGWRDIGQGPGNGAQVNWSGNEGSIYSEGNVGESVVFGTSGYGNHFFIHTVNTLPKYNNNKNVGYINATGTGNAFYKLFYLHIKSAVPFAISTSGAIPANSYMDFSSVKVYGITGTNSTFISSPSSGLPQGISYEVFYSGVDKASIRIHNNTANNINLPSIVWNCIAYQLM